MKELWLSIKKLFRRKDLHPWVKGTFKGSLYVDTSHPEWMAEFERKVKEMNKIDWTKVKILD